MMEESGGEGLWLLQRRENREASGSSREYPVDGHGWRRRIWKENERGGKRIEEGKGLWNWFRRKNGEKERRKWINDGKFAWKERKKKIELGRVGEGNVGFGVGVKMVWLENWDQIFFSIIYFYNFLKEI